MAMSRVTHLTPLSPSAAFDTVTDWRRHRVPFTRIVVTPNGFTARTGFGPLGFDDPMEVTLWDPPRRVVLRKLGRVVRGDATITVTQTPSGSAVTWDEDVSVIGVPRVFDPVLRRALGAMISLVLRRLLP
ncbi:SRPBCC family protein [Aeromicrobium sp.]|uniref:SRPBCC family protein n=1 Tax=Aeromicrobium sp. TaxID=1871063 RepID=UPI0028A840D3|nr:SRPBCC family protein [Aeromicrobium sp.]